MREKYLSLLAPRGNYFFPSHFVFTLTSHLFQCRWGQGRSEHKGLRMVKRQHYHSRKGPPHKIQPQSPVSSWAHLKQSGDFLHTAFKNGLTKQPECCLVSQTYEKKMHKSPFLEGSHKYACTVTLCLHQQVGWSCYSAKSLDCLLLVY